jgi:hypothetical protein
LLENTLIYWQVNIATCEAELVILRASLASSDELRQAAVARVELLDVECAQIKQALQTSEEMHQSLTREHASHLCKAQELTCLLESTQQKLVVVSTELENVTEKVKVSELTFCAKLAALSNEKNAIESNLLSVATQKSELQQQYVELKDEYHRISLLKDQVLYNDTLFIYKLHLAHVTSHMSFFYIFFRSWKNNASSIKPKWKLWRIANHTGRIVLPKCNESLY